VNQPSALFDVRRQLGCPQWVESGHVESNDAPGTGLGLSSRLSSNLPIFIVGEMSRFRHMRARRDILWGSAIHVIDAAAHSEWEPSLPLTHVS